MSCNAGNSSDLNFGSSTCWCSAGRLRVLRLGDLPSKGLLARRSSWFASAPRARFAAAAWPCFLLSDGPGNLILPCAAGAWCLSVAGWLDEIPGDEQGLAGVRKGRHQNSAYRKPKLQRRSSIGEPPSDIQLAARRGRNRAF